MYGGTHDVQRENVRRGLQADHRSHLYDRFSGDRLPAVSLGDWISPGSGDPGTGLLCLVSLDLQKVQETRGEDAPREREGRVKALPFFVRSV